MKRRAVGLAIVGLVAAFPVHADDDARAIVEKAFEAARANEAIARDYVYHERIEETRYNKKGEVKKRESQTWDVTLLDYSEYRRLIAKNDGPLFPETAAKEQRKLEKQLEKMRTETPKKRKKRLAKIEKGRKEGEAFLEEITKAFDFRLTGEEEIGGVATHVISFTPKESYKPRSREAKVLPKVRGTLWVSKGDYGWVQADMQTIGNIRWMVIFKLNEGARVRFTQRKHNDEVWLTDNWYVRIKARVAFVKFDGEVHGSYSNFRKFTTDTTPSLGEAGGRPRSHAAGPLR
ncbi:MAG: hypothetical protein GTN89_06955 [Acidobacteria bacterium]|nr:hypothetical protein [Acidobacteriota bacterium]NIM62760.1 hypothetical protein [Acidobacteriota bacterium]NIO59060.1 hypothetical protein [Acidobacteriota bacterium]NIQ30099.1 hypothetical protein [Acidobacteriota bacterium]NIQ84902.1 hypothetical protein [Acidobacteriota bacterium]